MFHHLDFPRLFLCESTGYSKHKTTGIASVAICGGSNHILTGLILEVVILSTAVIGLTLITASSCTSQTLLHTVTYIITYIPCPYTGGSNPE